MIIINKKISIILVLSGVLIILGMLISGCLQAQLCTVYPETQNQIIENITPEEAYVLIQKNMNNKKFVILDVRTPEEFASEHIEKAVNLDYYSVAFKTDLDQLDKNSAYLIYCRSGNRSGNTLSIMKNLDFREVYNMLGGIVNWKGEKFALREIILQELNYKELGPIIQAIESREGLIANISYDEKIAVITHLPESKQGWLNDMAKEVSHGRLIIKTGQVKWYKKS